MLDNLTKKLKNNTAFIKLRAVFSSLFHYFHKKMLWGLFSRFDEKFLKFLFVGALNTLFAYVLYAFFVAIGFVANVALVLEYFFGILWNFKTTGALVFKNSDNRLIFKFFGCYIFTFFFIFLFLYVLVNKCMLNDYLAQAILVPPIAVVSFFIMKFWVFKS